ncbi:MAG: ComEA family DNA-binding protein [Limisphaerales bacterium]
MAPHSILRPRDGFVLLMVLVVVMLASMVVTSLMFVLTAEQTAAAAGNSGEQARAAALSGIYTAMRAAAEASPGSTDWQDNPAVFRDQLVCDDGVQKWYFSVYSVSDFGGIRYGLADEAAKINVYRATEAMLEALPNMTPPLAQGLLGALGGGAPVAASDTNLRTAPVSAPASAPAPAAASVAPSSPVSASPFAPASALVASPAGNGQNRPWTCLDELLQISGFTVPLVYGSYSNLTGRAEVQGDALETTSASDAQESGPDAGLRQFLTVCSYDLDQDSEGRPRVNLNQDDLSSLGLSKGTVDYLMALRQSHQPLAHPVDLLDAPAAKDPQGKQAQVLAQITKEDLPILLDRCTATNQDKLIGLVNLNTASTRVLAALPGLSLSLAQAIVSARVGLSPEARTTPAWLYQDGLLNADAFKQAAPYLTTRSYQFRFRVAAYSMPAGGYCVLEAVVDAAAKPPSVLLLRDVTLLGLPFVPAPPQEDASVTLASAQR